MQKITEFPSQYDHLEQKSTSELLQIINREDQKVPGIIAGIIPQITPLVDAIVEKIRHGGRLFYIGAGSSGRLGVLDASEMAPTYGVSEDMVKGIIAGGDFALRNSVEKAEDDAQQGWSDLQAYGANISDVVIGITASGTTPYVVGALHHARTNGITTGCIVCNPGSPVAKESNFPVEVIVGPEFVTGSTRMKSGTAQKLVLNMISTSVMIRLGKVKGNRMVDMQLNNDKLYDRGIKMVMNKTKTDHATAETYLRKYGSVREAIEKIEQGI